MPKIFDIKNAVIETFGQDTSVVQARKWIEEKVRAHKDIMLYVKSILSSIIEAYENEVKQKNNRMVAVLMQEEEYMVKSTDSIIEKIWRNLQNSGTCNKENFHESMEDILRFRILCNYLTDIKALKKFLPEKMSEKGYEIVNGIKDFIEQCPEDRKRGHRAVHFVFKISLNKKDFLFEVQLMTLLQNAWDKKDHHLVYEYRRRSEEVPLELKIRSYAMSEMLFVADDFFSNILLEDQKKGDG